MQFKESRTYANLMAAYTGESQASVKYQIFAEKARKDGYEQIAQIFEETSKNETAHAREWFERLHEGIGDTKLNLEDAANGEHYEWSHMYKEFETEATREGYADIAKKFQLVASIEEQHEKRYNKLIQNMKNNEVFKKSVSSVWQCRYCGYNHEGDSAPDVCPVCSKKKAFYEIKPTNY